MLRRAVVASPSSSATATRAACLRCLFSADAAANAGELLPTHGSGYNSSDRSTRTEQNNQSRRASASSRLTKSRNKRKQFDMGRQGRQKTAERETQQRSRSNSVGLNAATARKAALLLPKATERMESFLRARAELPPPPSAWLHPVDMLDDVTNATEHTDVLAQRAQLHNDVVQLLLILRDSITGGHISPRGGSNSLILSDLLGNILLLLGESPPKMLLRNVTERIIDGKKITLSSADAAGVVLNLLRRMNLDVRPDHYASAIRAACHDGRWKMASDLFSAQVDPDSAGLVPVDSTLGYGSTVELGLYAIARQSEIESQESTDELSIPVANKVFDAALSMSIISPTDQDNCEWRRRSIAIVLLTFFCDTY